MRAARTWILPLCSLAGCFIFPFPRHHHHNNNDDALVPQDTAGPVVETDSPDRPADDPTDLRFHPSGAARSQTIIASLVDHTAPPVDLSSVTDVDLIGPSRAQVLAVQPRDSREVLVTVRVPPRGDVGQNDAIVTFADGSSIYLQDAFLVVATEGEAPADVWTGDTGTTPVDTTDTTPVDTTDTTPVDTTDTTDTTPVDTTDTTPVDTTDTTDTTPVDTTDTTDTTPVDTTDPTAP